MEARRAGLENATLRSNPAYELVLMDALSDEQIEALGEPICGAGFYGILRPRQEQRLHVKAVDRDTALLFLTLATPRRLPRYVTNALGAWHDEISLLVLDGVLEIQDPSGSFVSGAGARQVVEARGDSSPSSTARLSVDAVRYGQALALSDAAVLAARMYFYNREPLTPAWRRRLPSAVAVRRYLGLEGVEGPDRILGRHWSKASSRDAWLVWRSRLAPPAAPRDRFAYKLYVSPTCDALPDAFESTVRVMTTAGAPALKVGADLPGILRPDKIVVYFLTFEELQAAAHALLDDLSGCPVQGVPFTAEISDDGLVSWGMDPPRSRRVGWARQESWRLWVATQLAIGLVAPGTRGGDVMEPWELAIARLRALGVDPTTWTPRQDVWGHRVEEAAV